MDEDRYTLALTSDLRVAKVVLDLARDDFTSVRACRRIIDGTWCHVITVDIDEYAAWVADEVDQGLT